MQLVFRKKTRGQVIGAELQEGFTHLGVAATQAGRLAAEQVSPRVAAAREAAAPAYEAAREAVVPKVAAAVAAAAPAVATARDTLAPRVEAARTALAPRLDAAQAAAAKAAADLAPRVEAAREAAAPRVASAVSAAQVAAARAAADLAPRVEAAQKTLKDDVVPRLEAAQVAALAYATPKVAAARGAVAPALESARETLVAGVDSARSELDARRAELAAAAESSGRKARKVAKKARKNAGRKHREFEKAALATAKTVKRKAGVEPEPRRRWTWVFGALLLGTAAFVALRRRKDDDWTPAPAGDGPVPSYREDPVPSSENSGKTVSTADQSGDASPNESDMGVRDAQLVDGDGPDDETVNGTDAPQPFTSGGNADEGPTAGPQGNPV
ncbi:hypothetical protein JKP75_06920 [Blastococcus sp. TML/M2B]|uniref:hypothetical protein n=1 Tax=Blastococcus sp. TML/M2B TaxID=2798727 RepID=UPI00190D6400|nr:hypothetical protein [Blastococcus sp. TML/M2B]MBN1092322.1 hypothetical protein [Blastococcus sp. TML/M2B]